MANPSAELMTIAAWLEAVGDGLGAHAHIIEGYGAADVALLSALDEEDIKEIIDLLRRSPGAPPPLQVKLITKALASEVKRHAKRAAEHDRVRTPTTDPIPNRGSAKGTAASDSDSGPEEKELECTSAEEDSDNDQPASNTGKSPGAAASTSTARPRARNGKQRAQKSAAATAAGKATINQLFGRSASKNNWHGLGGQARAAAAVAGRARPFGGLGQRVKGQVCTNPCGQEPEACCCPADGTEQPERCRGAHDCARQLALIVEGAHVASKRTPNEVTKRGGTASTYNFARLRLYLIHHAFDAQGNALVHLFCLMAELDVSNWFMTALHKDAVKRAQAKIESIPKSKVLSLSLTDEQVVRPEGSLGSLSAYLATLKDEDLVEVVSSQVATGSRARKRKLVD